VESGRAIDGLAVGAWRVRAPELHGIAVSIAQTRTTDLTGLGIGAFNEVRGVQKGITIGLYNDARRLNGFQIGLLNRARNNPAPFEYLPILNAHFD
jgi:hypothetical protein